MPELSPPVSERDHIRGELTAPIVLVEYADFECPACGQAYFLLQEICKRLDGALCLVFRNFPLTTLHPHAASAAAAAEAAGLQERFWEMHDLIYENQRVLDASRLAEYVRLLNLDAAQFAHDHVSPAVAACVREDFISGTRSGVNGTPTFFINGTRFDGPWGERMLLNALEQTIASPGDAAGSAEIEPSGFGNA